MKTTILNIIGAIGVLNFSLLFKGLNDIFSTESSWISDEGQEILNNPEDRKKVEEAVNLLKQGKEANPVTLSNGRIINISID